MRGVFLLLPLLSAVYGGGKLSDAENLARSKTCGKVVKAGRDVPWMTLVHYKRDSFSYHTSAFVISSRHVVTSSIVAVNPAITGKRAKWQMNGKYVDMSTCKFGVMPLPKHILAGMTAQACGPHGDYCWTNATKLQPRRGVYLGNCDTTKSGMYGIVVLEMDTDFAVDKGVNPVCFDRGVPLKMGDELELHTWRWGHVGGKTTIENCGFQEFYYMSTCVKNLGCDADQGAAYVRKHGGRVNAVAVLWYGRCQNGEVVPAVDLFNFYWEICTFSGVCDANPSAGMPPKRIIGKLTREENRQRAATCGGKLQSKLFGGKYISGDKAPWAAKVQAFHSVVGDPTAIEEFVQGAFFVSRRHVITTMHTLFAYWKDKELSFTWSLGDKPVDRSTCKDGKMPVPEHIVAKMFVSPCAYNGAGDECNVEIKIEARSATYIGDCDPTADAFGFVLIEMEVEVSTDYVNYLCVPETEITAPGDQLNVYSVGQTSEHGPFEGRLNFVTSKVIECKDSHEMVICVESVGGCGSDGGAAYTKTVNGKQVAVAVMNDHIFGAACQKDRQKTYEISIAHFSRQICEVSGICKS